MHVFLAIYGWLVFNGLWRAVITAVVSLLIAAAIAWRPFRGLKRDQDSIKDSLDTSTPGALRPL